MNIKKNTMPYLVVFVLLCLVLFVWLVRMDGLVGRVHMTPVQSLSDYED